MCRLSSYFYHVSDHSYMKIWPQIKPQRHDVTVKMEAYNSRNLHVDVVLYQRYQYFSKGKVVKLAHHLFSALSLRLLRNAYAGEKHCSAPQLGYQLHSIDGLLSTLAFTNQAALDGRGFTH